MLETADPVVITLGGQLGCHPPCTSSVIPSRRATSSTRRCWRRRRGKPAIRPTAVAAGPIAAPEAASLAVNGSIVSIGLVAPEMLPPFTRLVPLRRQRYDRMTRFTTKKARNHRGLNNVVDFGSIVCKSIQVPKEDKEKSIFRLRNYG